MLVATKLHPPQPRTDLVRRPSLLERLIASRGRKLALFCAPAGWGKTVLLSQWQASEAETRPFAWVSLDAGDSDPVRFWSYVIGAVRKAQAGVGDAAWAGLRAGGSDLEDAVVGPLINDLAAMPSEMVLVLDDYHLVRSEVVHRSLAFLLRNLPQNVQLAVASRADPPLPLAGLRADGQVVEVRATELSFNDMEASALLNESLALGLDRAEVALLRARTEGWAAGLQLAALSLRGQDDKRAFIDAFAGDDRQIGDYLHEVLEDQPLLLRRFLLQTSILERLCAPLCGAVTGAADAAARLEQVERANLFLVPLDPHRRWYRYHHLFRDLLRHELTTTQPEHVEELHRRAAAWHRGEGDVEAAIAHATKAGDFQEAGELIAEHNRRFMSIGQTETVASWIDDLPREAVLGDARLCLARGWTALYSGRLEAAGRWRRRATQAPLPGSLYDEMPSVAANAALLEAVEANIAGDVKGGIAAGRRAVALHGDETNPGLGVACIALGACLCDRGLFAEAVPLLERGIRVLPLEGWVAPIVGLACLAGAYAELGQIDRAEHVLLDAERTVDRLMLDEVPWVARTRLERGKLCEQRGHLDAAETSFARACVLARRGGRRLELAHALVLLARLKRRRGEHEAAGRLIREARTVSDDCPDPGVLGELLDRTERSLRLARPSSTMPVVPDAPELSEREQTILRLFASELSQREIGAELYISVNTVKFHARSIFRKLAVAGRADAVARGRELGLM